MNDVVAIVSPGFFVGLGDVVVVGVVGCIVPESRTAPVSPPITEVVDFFFFFVDPIHVVAVTVGSTFSPDGSSDVVVDPATTLPVMESVVLVAITTRSVVATSSATTGETHNSSFPVTAFVTSSCGTVM